MVNLITKKGCTFPGAPSFYFSQKEAYQDFQGAQINSFIELTLYGKIELDIFGNEITVWSDSSDFKNRRVDNKDVCLTKLIDDRTLTHYVQSPDKKTYYICNSAGKVLGYSGKETWDDLKVAHSFCLLSQITESK